MDFHDDQRAPRLDQKTFSLRNSLLVIFIIFNVLHKASTTCNQYGFTCISDSTFVTCQQPWIGNTLHGDEIQSCPKGTTCDDRMNQPCTKIESFIQDSTSKCSHKQLACYGKRIVVKCMFDMITDTYQPTGPYFLCPEGSLCNADTDLPCMQIHTKSKRDIQTLNSDTYFSLKSRVCGVLNIGCEIRKHNSFHPIIVNDNEPKSCFEPGLFGHSRNCQYFFTCVPDDADENENYVELLWKCRSGEMFSKIERRCVPIAEVECINDNVPLRKATRALVSGCSLYDVFFKKSSDPAFRLSYIQIPLCGKINIGDLVCRDNINFACQDWRYTFTHDPYKLYNCNDQGVYRDPFNCKVTYTCIPTRSVFNYYLIVRVCPQNMVYSIVKGTCVDEELEDCAISLEQELISNDNMMYESEYYRDNVFSDTSIIQTIDLNEGRACDKIKAILGISIEKTKKMKEEYFKKIQNSIHKTDCTTTEVTPKKVTECTCKAAAIIPTSPICPIHSIKTTETYDTSIIKRIDGSDDKYKYEKNETETRNVSIAEDIKNITSEYSVILIGKNGTFYTENFTYFTQEPIITNYTNIELEDKHKFTITDENYNLINLNTTIIHGNNYSSGGDQNEIKPYTSTSIIKSSKGDDILHLNIQKYLTTKDIDDQDTSNITIEHTSIVSIEKITELYSENLFANTTLPQEPLDITVKYYTSPSNLSSSDFVDIKSTTITDQQTSEVMEPYEVTTYFNDFKKTVTWDSQTIHYDSTTKFDNLLTQFYFQNETREDDIKKIESTTIKIDEQTKIATEPFEELTTLHSSDFNKTDKFLTGTWDTQTIHFDSTTKSDSHVTQFYFENVTRETDIKITDLEQITIDVSKYSMQSSSDISQSKDYGFYPSTTPISEEITTHDKVTATLSYATFTDSHLSTTKDEQITYETDKYSKQTTLTEHFIDINTTDKFVTDQQTLLYYDSTTKSDDLVTHFYFENATRKFDIKITDSELLTVDISKFSVQSTPLSDVSQSKEYTLHTRSPISIDLTTETQKTDKDSFTSTYTTSEQFVDDKLITIKDIKETSQYETASTEHFDGFWNTSKPVTDTWDDKTIRYDSSTKSDSLSSQVTFDNIITREDEIKITESDLFSVHTTKFTIQPTLFSDISKEIIFYSSTPILDITKETEIIDTDISTAWYRTTEPFVDGKFTTIKYEQYTTETDEDVMHTTPSDYLYGIEKTVMHMTDTWDYQTLRYDSTTKFTQFENATHEDEISSSQFHIDISKYTMQSTLSSKEQESKEYIHSTSPFNFDITEQTHRYDKNTSELSYTETSETFDDISTSTTMEDQNIRTTSPAPYDYKTTNEVLIKTWDKQTLLYDSTTKSDGLLTYFYFDNTTHDGGIKITDSQFHTADIFKYSTPLSNVSQSEEYIYYSTTRYNYDMTKHAQILDKNTSMSWDTTTELFIDVDITTTKDIQIVNITDKYETDYYNKFNGTDMTDTWKQQTLLYDSTTKSDILITQFYFDNFTREGEINITEIELHISDVSSISTPLSEVSQSKEDSYYASSTIFDEVTEQTQLHDTSISSYTTSGQLIDSSASIIITDQYTVNKSEYSAWQTTTPDYYDHDYKKTQKYFTGTWDRQTLLIDSTTKSEDLLTQFSYDNASFEGDIKITKSELLTVDIYNFSMQSTPYVSQSSDYNYYSSTPIEHEQYQDTLKSSYATSENIVDSRYSTIKYEQTSPETDYYDQQTTSSKYFIDLQATDKFKTDTWDKQTLYFESTTISNNLITQFYFENITREDEVKQTYPEFHGVNMSSMQNYTLYDVSQSKEYTLHSSTSVYDEITKQTREKDTSKSSYTLFDSTTTIKDTFNGTGSYETMTSDHFYVSNKTDKFLTGTWEEQSAAYDKTTVSDALGTQFYIENATRMDEIKITDSEIDTVDISKFTTQSYLLTDISQSKEFIFYTSSPIFKETQIFDEKSSVTSYTTSSDFIDSKLTTQNLQTINETDEYKITSTEYYSTDIRDQKSTSYELTTKSDTLLTQFPSLNVTRDIYIKINDSDIFSVDMSSFSTQSTLISDFSESTEHIYDSTTPRYYDIISNHTQIYGEDSSQSSYSTTELIIDAGTITKGRQIINETEKYETKSTDYFYDYRSTDKFITGTWDQHTLGYDSTTKYDVSFTHENITHEDEVKITDSEIYISKFSLQSTAIPDVSHTTEFYSSILPEGVETTGQILDVTKSTFTEPIFDSTSTTITDRQTYNESSRHETASTDSFDDYKKTDKLVTDTWFQQTLLYDVTTKFDSLVTQFYFHNATEVDEINITDTDTFKFSEKSTSSLEVSQSKEYIYYSTTPTYYELTQTHKDISIISSTTSELLVDSSITTKDQQFITETDEYINQTTSTDYYKDFKKTFNVTDTYDQQTIRYDSTIKLDSLLTQFYFENTTLEDEIKATDLELSTGFSQNLTLLPNVSQSKEYVYYSSTPFIHETTVVQDSIDKNITVPSSTTSKLSTDSRTTSASDLLTTFDTEQYEMYTKSSSYFDGYKNYTHKFVTDTWDLQTLYYDSTTRSDALVTQHYFEYYTRDDEIVTSSQHLTVNISKFEVQTSLSDISQSKDYIFYPSTTPISDEITTQTYDKVTAMSSYATFTDSHVPITKDEQITYETDKYSNQTTLTEHFIEINTTNKFVTNQQTLLYYDSTTKSDELVTHFYFENATVEGDIKITDSELLTVDISKFSVQSTPLIDVSQSKEYTWHTSSPISVDITKLSQKTDEDSFTSSYTTSEQFIDDKFTTSADQVTIKETYKYDQSTSSEYLYGIEKTAMHLTGTWDQQTLRHDLTTESVTRASQLYFENTTRVSEFTITDSQLFSYNKSKFSVQSTLYPDVSQSKEYIFYSTTPSDYYLTKQTAIYDTESSKLSYTTSDLFVVSSASTSQDQQTYNKTDQYSQETTDYYIEINKTDKLVSDSWDGQTLRYGLTTLPTASQTQFYFENATRDDEIKSTDLHSYTVDTSKVSDELTYISNFSHSQELSSYSTTPIDDELIKQTQMQYNDTSKLSYTTSDLSIVSSASTSQEQQTYNKTDKYAEQTTLADYSIEINTTDKLVTDSLEAQTLRYGSSTLPTTSHTQFYSENVTCEDEIKLTDLYSHTDDIYKLSEPSTYLPNVSHSKGFSFYSTTPSVDELIKQTQDGTAKLSYTTLEHFTDRKSTAMKDQYTIKQTDQYEEQSTTSDYLYGTKQTVLHHTGTWDHQTLRQDLTTESVTLATQLYFENATRLSEFTITDSQLFSYNKSKFSVQSTLYPDVSQSKEYVFYSTTPSDYDLAKQTEIYDTESSKLSYTTSDLFVVSSASTSQDQQTYNKTDQYSQQTTDYYIEINKTDKLVSDSWDGQTLIYGLTTLPTASYTQFYFENATRDGEMKSTDLHYYTVDTSKVRDELTYISNFSHSQELSFYSTTPIDDELIQQTQMQYNDTSKLSYTTSDLSIVSSASTSQEQQTYNKTDQYAEQTTLTDYSIEIHTTDKIVTDSLDAQTLRDGSSTLPTTSQTQFYSENVTCEDEIKLTDLDSHTDDIYKLTEPSTYLPNVSKSKEFSFYSTTPSVDELIKETQNGTAKLSYTTLEHFTDRKPMTMKDQFTIKQTDQYEEKSTTSDYLYGTKQTVLHHTGTWDQRTLRQDLTTESVTLATQFYVENTTRVSEFTITDSQLFSYNKSKFSVQSTLYPDVSQSKEYKFYSTTPSDYYLTKQTAIYDTESSKLSYTTSDLFVVSSASTSQDQQTYNKTDQYSQQTTDYYIEINKTDKLVSDSWDGQTLIYGLTTLPTASYTQFYFENATRDGEIKSTDLHSYTVDTSNVRDELTYISNFSLSEELSSYSTTPTVDELIKQTQMQYNDTSKLSYSTSDHFSDGKLTTKDQYTIRQTDQYEEQTTSSDYLYGTKQTVLHLTGTWDQQTLHYTTESSAFVTQFYFDNITREDKINITDLDLHTVDISKFSEQLTSITNIVQSKEYINYSSTPIYDMTKVTQIKDKDSSELSYTTRDVDSSISTSMQDQQTTNEYKMYTASDYVTDIKKTDLWDKQSSLYDLTTKSDALLTQYYFENTTREDELNLTVSETVYNNIYKFTMQSTLFPGVAHSKEYIYYSTSIGDEITKETQTLDNNIKSSYTTPDISVTSMIDTKTMRQTNQYETQTMSSEYTGLHNITELTTWSSKSTEEPDYDIIDYDDDDIKIIWTDEPSMILKGVHKDSKSVIGYYILKSQNGSLSCIHTDINNCIEKLKNEFEIVGKKIVNTKEVSLYSNQNKFQVIGVYNIFSEEGSMPCNLKSPACINQFYSSHDETLTETIPSIELSILDNGDNDFLNDTFGLYTDKEIILCNNSYISNCLSKLVDITPHNKLLIDSTEYKKITFGDNNKSYYVWLDRNKYDCNEENIMDCISLWTNNNADVTVKNKATVVMHFDIKDSGKSDITFTDLQSTYTSDISTTFTIPITTTTPAPVFDLSTFLRIKKDFEFSPSLILNGGLAYKQDIKVGNYIFETPKDRLKCSSDSVPDCVIELHEMGRTVGRGMNGLTQNVNIFIGRARKPMTYSLLSYDNTFPCDILKPGCLNQFSVDSSFDDDIYVPSMDITVDESLDINGNFTNGKFHIITDNTVSKCNSMLITSCMKTFVEETEERRINVKDNKIYQLSFDDDGEIKIYYLWLDSNLCKRGGIIKCISDWHKTARRIINKEIPSKIVLFDYSYDDYKLKPELLLDIDKNNIKSPFLFVKGIYDLDGENEKDINDIIFVNNQNENNCLISDIKTCISNLKTYNIKNLSRKYYNSFKVTIYSYKNRNMPLISYRLLDQNHSLPCSIQEVSCLNSIAFNKSSQASKTMSASLTLPIDSYEGSGIINRTFTLADNVSTICTDHGIISCLNSYASNSEDGDIILSTVLLYNISLNHNNNNNNSIFIWFENNYECNLPNVIDCILQWSIQGGEVSVEIMPVEVVSFDINILRDDYVTTTASFSTSETDFDSGFRDMSWGHSGKSSFNNQVISPITPFHDISYSSSDNWKKYSKSLLIKTIKSNSLSYADQVLMLQYKNGDSFCDTNIISNCIKRLNLPPGIVEVKKSISQQVNIYQFDSSVLPMATYHIILDEGNNNISCDSSDMKCVYAQVNDSNVKYKEETVTIEFTIKNKALDTTEFELDTFQKVVCFNNDIISCLLKYPDITKYAEVKIIPTYIYHMSSVNTNNNITYNYKIVFESNYFQCDNKDHLKCILNYIIKGRRTEILGVLLKYVIFGNAEKGKSIKTFDPYGPKSTTPSKIDFRNQGGKFIGTLALDKSEEFDSFEYYGKSGSFTTINPSILIHNTANFDGNLDCNTDDIIAIMDKADLKVQAARYDTDSKLPPVLTPDGYIVMQENVGCVKGGSFGDRHDCASFHICAAQGKEGKQLKSSDSLVYLQFHCTPGNYFSAVKRMCIETDAECPSKYFDNVPDYLYKFDNLREHGYPQIAEASQCKTPGIYSVQNSCNRYYMCFHADDDTLVTFNERCPVGTKYHRKKQICVATTVDECPEAFYNPENNVQINLSVEE